MKINIAGDIASIKSVIFSGRGFGKNLNENIYDYELIINANEFLNEFEGIYNDCIDELIHDDKITGEFRPLYEGSEIIPLYRTCFLCLSLPKLKALMCTKLVWK